MNTRLLNKEVREFIIENEQASITAVILKGSPFEGISGQELAQQLSGYKKTKKKLPTWHASTTVFYPPNLNLEQTSSEAAASYKSQLVSGNILVDSTGGYGVDSYYFSKKVTQVIHCDLNVDLQKIAAHNFEALGSENITSLHADGIKTALETSNVDWLYIDPSRRNDTKGKVFFLKDCLPNVPKILDDCFNNVDNILVKTAPILDISIGLSELNNVKEIHVVAVNNEVKELLWVLEKGFRAEPTLVAANIVNEKTTSVQLMLSAEKEVSYTLNEVSDYVYEPFSSVMKTGAFNWLSDNFKVDKLHINSHLYTSKNQVYFPGKAFKVTVVLQYNKKNMKSLVGVKANVVTRNFKMSVADLRKKFKIKEGANRFLFFTTNFENQQIVIDCNKVIYN